MKPRRWNPSIPFPALALTTLAAQALLQQWLARHDVVSALFAAGPHVPPGRLALAGVFVILRLFVFLVLPPALIIWGVRWGRRRVHGDRP